MGYDDPPLSKGWKIGLSVLGIALLVIILLPVFWFFFLETVGPTEYGIAVNNFTGKTNYEVYESGLHFVPLSRFARFPKTLQTIEFANPDDVKDGIGRLEARTKDGLDISFRISLQYKLQKENLDDLFREFGREYEPTYIEIARGEIRNLASQHTAIEYFNDTTEISKEFHDGLRTIINEQGYADVPFFQLKGVKLPTEFEDAINRAEVAQRNIEIAELEQQEAIIRAQTSIIEARAAADITILQAEANAESFLININAQAEGINITLTQQSASYYALAQTLGLNSTELLIYLWIQAVMEHDSSYLIIGNFTPLLPINTPTP